MASEAVANPLVRALAMPFWPRLWRESPEHGSGWVLPALVLWALASGVLGGYHIATSVREQVYQVALTYEANADPLLLDQGRFSLTGPRILRLQSDDGRSLFLVDPANTVPDAELTAQEYLAVRADRVVLQQPGQRREWSAVEVGKLFGEHVLFDGKWLRRTADEWVYPFLIGGMPVIFAFIAVAKCAVYAFAVAVLLLLLRGQWIGLDYSKCVTVALATSSVVLAADVALTLLAVAPPLPAFLLWPGVMAVLGFVALAGRSAPAEPDAPL